MTDQLKVPGGGLGVCSSGLHVLCGSGEGVYNRVTHTVEGASVVQGPGPWHKVEFVPCGGWPPLGLRFFTNPDIHGEDIEA